MKIVVLKESAAHEKRVALTPEVAKKIIDSGHDVIVEEHAGKEAGFTDAAYEKSGVKITKSRSKSLKEADIILQVSGLCVEDVSLLKENTVLISMLKTHTPPLVLAKLVDQKISSFALDLLPRLSRAQSMDVLSSQSNLAGYKAVVEAASEYDRAFPMMMTAAGTIAAAKVLVLGAGVAGLQAIATAKRLGAIVTAFDVRPAAKEQVESLGAKFIHPPIEESGEGDGGYAKEMSSEYKKHQEALLKETIKNQDIVITTAQIQGQKAPLLICEEMVESMRGGAIIYDLAIESGGNCQISEPGKMIIKHGVKIMAYLNVPSRIAQDSSQLYAKNIINFLKIILDQETKKIAINWEDDLIKGCCLTHGGALMQPHVKI